MLTKVEISATQHVDIIMPEVPFMHSLLIILVIFLMLSTQMFTQRPDVLSGPEIWH